MHHQNLGSNKGRVTALPQGGDLRSDHIEAYRDVILAAIEAKVDITLVELSDLLRHEHGSSSLRVIRDGITH